MVPGPANKSATILHNHHHPFRLIGVRVFFSSSQRTCSLNSPTQPYGAHDLHYKSTPPIVRRIHSFVSRQSARSVLVDACGVVSSSVHLQGYSTSPLWIWIKWKCVWVCGGFVATRIRFMTSFGEIERERETVWRWSHVRIIKWSHLDTLSECLSFRWHRRVLSNRSSRGVLVGGPWCVHFGDTGAAKRINERPAEVQCTAEDIHFTLCQMKPQASFS